MVPAAGVLDNPKFQDSPVLLNAFLQAPQPSVPDIYVLPPTLRPKIAHNYAPVPSFDFLDQSPAAMDLAQRSLREWGLLQVFNHGVDPLLMENLKTQSTKLLTLPVDAKLKLHRLGGRTMGYTVNENSFTDSPCCPWSEAFTVPTSVWGGMDVLEKTRTVFESEQAWLEFSSAYKSFANGLFTFSLDMLRVIIQCLKLDPADFSSLLNDARSVIRFSRYPISPEPDKTMGLGAHKDTGTLTILCELDDIGAFQVYKDGEWFTIKPRTDSFLVFGGSILQAATNNLVCALYHRVVNNSTRERHSINFSILPNPDALICAPLVLKPHMYRPFTGKEMARIKEETRNYELLHLLKLNDTHN